MRQTDKGKQISAIAWRVMTLYLLWWCRVLPQLLFVMFVRRAFLNCICQKEHFLTAFIYSKCLLCQFKNKAESFLMPQAVFIHHNHCTSPLSSPPSSPHPLFFSITLHTMQMDEALEWYRDERGESDMGRQ